MRSIRMITRSSGSGQATNESRSSQSESGSCRCFAGKSGRTACSAYRQKWTPGRNPDPARLRHLEVVADVEPADRSALDPLDRHTQVVELHHVLGHAATLDNRRLGVERAEQGDRGRRARLGSKRQDDRAVRSLDYLAQRLCGLFER